MVFMRDRNISTQEKDGVLQKTCNSSSEGSDTSGLCMGTRSRVHTFHVSYIKKQTKKLDFLCNQSS